MASFSFGHSAFNKECEIELEVPFSVSKGIIRIYVLRVTRNTYINNN